MARSVFWLKGAAPLLALTLTACAGLSGPRGPRPPAGALEAPVLPLEIQFMKAAAVHLSFTKASFDFNLKIQNPNEKAAEIQSAEYILQISGQKPIKGKIDEPLAVPAGGSARLPILLNAPLSLFAGEEKAEWYFEALLTGRISPLPPVEMRMSRRGRMPIPQPPKIRLKAIQIHAGAEKGRLLVEVENPNKFLIRATALQIVPTLNGHLWKASRATADVEIFGGKKGLVELPFVVDYAKLPAELSDAFFKKGETAYQARGVLSVQTPLPLMPTAQFPFEAAGTAPVERPAYGERR